jgi:hydrogenase maturation protein HypF
MKSFEMCADCRLEYEDPQNRRFHAQPNACPLCGPRLELWEAGGGVVESADAALMQSVQSIREGMTVAVKGLGGFHLLADARNEDAVQRLRARKHREEKPLALMYPSLESAARDCEIPALEERLLRSAECPIVLLRRRAGADVAPSVAPRNPCLGVMLPYTPLHHLLLREFGQPVVATSGNISDEPICTDEREALDRLGDVADLFLVHNRPIVRHVDDSIVRVMLGRELILRRARGYAPLPVTLVVPATGILAVGGHLKNTIALTVGSDAFISQHIGDLETEQSSEAFRSVIRSFGSLYKTAPQRVVTDMHPDYLSRKFGLASGLPVLEVQHHLAHIASCMAENELEGRVLGVSWDGTGYGTDGRIWGGEFLLTDGLSFEREASMREFQLPGGARAIREPRRTALGLLHAIYGNDLDPSWDLPPLNAFTKPEIGLVLRMLEKGINSPVTSSAGRLFDAVASLTGLRQVVSFEGQAAMELEFALDEDAAPEEYPFELISDSHRMLVDWKPLILALIADVSRGVPAGTISARFHNTLVGMILAVAGHAGERRVVLSGGCFQNRVLTERAVMRLKAAGYKPYWHQRVPPNDGGIALGQAYAAALTLKKQGSAEEASDNRPPAYIEAKE